MATVLHQNPSGLTSADKASMRMIMCFHFLEQFSLTCAATSLIMFFILQTSLVVIRFGSVEKKPFDFLHCWDVLKDEPKWVDHHIGQQPRTISLMPSESYTIDLDLKDSIPGITT